MPPLTTPWSAPWILEFLRLEKKNNSLPFQRLAEEAKKHLSSVEDVKAAMFNVCSLIDRKTAETAAAMTGAPNSRKRRRPFGEDENSPTPANQFGEEETKRLRQLDKENDTGISQRLVNRAEALNEGRESAQLIVECSQDTTAQASSSCSPSPAPALRDNADLLMMRQLCLTSELSKLAQLMCTMKKIDKGGVSEAIDIDVRKFDNTQLILVARLFTGILLQAQLLDLPLADQFPDEKALASVIKNRALPILAASPRPLPVACAGLRLHGRVKETLTHEGLEDLRSLVHKLAKVYALFYKSCEQRNTQLLEFAKINPDQSTPSNRAMLEKAVDLRKNLIRICERDIPEGVDEMRTTVTLSIIGQVDIELFSTLIEEHELSSLWLASGYLEFTPAEPIVLLLEHHFTRYRQKLDDIIMKKQRAEAAAVQKEEERKAAAGLRLTNIKPVLEYLKWSETIARAAIKNSDSGTPLNPCLVLGIPYMSLNKSVMKKLKLKVQASLHPDKFNLQWVPDEDREELADSISHAFRLVTESLTELQKFDVNSAKWLSAGPTRPPPYAEEIGLEWPDSCPTGQRASAEMRRRSCPPCETPMKRSPPRTETPAQTKPSSATRKSSALPATTPLSIRHGGSAIQKDGVLRQCFRRKTTSLDDANVVGPVTGRITCPSTMTCRQGVCEFVVEVKYAGLPSELRSSSNRLLYVWLAAPKLKDSQQNFETRVVVQYTFPLSFCHPFLRLVLENVPLIGCGRTVKYEVIVVEVLPTASTAPGCLQHSEPQHLNLTFEAPPLRESGVNMYRNSLLALFGLSQMDAVYSQVLESFNANAVANGGAPWIKNLRRQDARQLLESVNNDLAPFL